MHLSPALQKPVGQSEAGKDFQGSGLDDGRPAPSERLLEPIDQVKRHPTARQLDPEYEPGRAGADDENRTAWHGMYLPPSQFPNPDHQAVSFRISSPASHAPTSAALSGALRSDQAADIGRRAAQRAAWFSVSEIHWFRSERRRQNVGCGPVAAYASYTREPLE